MQCVRLQELLQGVQLDFISSRSALQEAVVDAVSTDTRSLKKNDLFIALPGDMYDGHAFIDRAVDGGAMGVLFESRKRDEVRRFMKGHESTLFIAVPDSRRALGSIAANYIRRFRVRKIALTGSAGKTTTKSLIDSILSQRYRVVSSIRSFNNDIGVPKTILEVDGATEILVQEIGTNHPGEIAHLAGIVQPDCGLITAIGPAHIGFFGTERAIAREKRQLFRSLDPDGTAFVNGEDRFCSFLKRGSNCRFSAFGLRSGDLYPDRIIRTGLEYAEFLLGGEAVRVEVLGLHGVLNAVAAALVGRHFGLSFDEIRTGLEQFRGESGRGTVVEKGGIRVIDESYNANPLSVSASLRLLGGLETGGRKIFVFADMLELGRKSNHYHRAIAGDIVRSGADEVFTFGEKARMTGERCRDAGMRVFHFDDMEMLRFRLKKEVREGDLVLVKGSRAMQLERAIRGLV
jgi:UDP-N-acetylmuramoyl-tripeptide--D-alanyl-D-alanine ligase